MNLGNQLWDKLDQFVGKKVIIKKIENVHENHYFYRDGEWRFSWSKKVEMMITYEGIVEKAEIDTLMLIDCKIISPHGINDMNPSHTRLELCVEKDRRMPFSASLCEFINIATE